jgi:hypothetical protein
MVRAGERSSVSHSNAASSCDNVPASAGGKREFCGCPGFTTSSGEVYLETHHIVPLSELGLDIESNAIRQQIERGAVSLGAAVVPGHLLEAAIAIHRPSGTLPVDFDGRRGRRSRRRRCGILDFGFLELECMQCGRTELVALSCKRRGFVPPVSPAA